MNTKLDGKDLIINKILENSKMLSDAILNDAEEKAASTINAANTMAQDYVTKMSPRIMSENQSIMARLSSAARIDSKKIELQAKQQLIDSALKAAEQKLLSKGKAEYLKFINSVLAAHSEEGDEVIISEKDKDIITASLIADIARKKNIGLTLSKSYGSFKGGLVLRQPSYDKNFTYDALLSYAGENLRTRIADILFGTEHEA